MKKFIIKLMRNDTLNMFCCSFAMLPFKALVNCITVTSVVPVLLFLISPLYKSRVIIIDSIAILCELDGVYKLCA